ncbi:MAG: DUF4838 domain-containing protein [Bacteroidota bacterium]|nr:DUF4838 domain-containing protein [Bacteroidota bacterium]
MLLFSYDSRKTSTIFSVIVFAMCFASAQSRTIDLVSNHKTNYKIILSKTASRWDTLAARTLQSSLQQISGALIPIADGTSPQSKHEIIFGEATHSARLKSFSRLKEDGFTITTIGETIYFYGNRKGALYAVATFLERYLRCRFYSRSVNVFPQQNSIVLPSIDIDEHPAFRYRSISSFETADDAYCQWHKLADSNDRRTWGLFVHTFHILLPPEKYFKGHPEYFALRDSLRVPEQPCLSNPEVFKIVVEELRKRMKENPAAAIWSVSQNDNGSYCQCEACRRIDEEEGSHSGSLLAFVNKVAREFPGKIISTLAYQYSRRPPMRIKPEKNVNIMLCSIEALRTHPLEADTSSDSFAHDLIGWSKLTNNLFIWDYVVQFTNLVSPFPNFHVLQPNIRLFSKYGAAMVFEQGAGNRAGAEFSELRSYLLAKLLWDPSLNVDSLMHDFLSGYYGNAGKYIRSYIDMMTSELIRSSAQLWIYDSPVNAMNNYLAPDLMKEYNAMFDSAEAAVAGQPEFFERVKTARLPLSYATLEQAKVIGEGESGTYIKEDDGGFRVNPKIRKLLNEFLSECKHIGNVQINEKQLSAETYGERYTLMLSKTMHNPLGLFKPVRFLTQPSWKYPANGEKTLTDGKRGDEDHHFNWLGFEGEDMDVVVDLQQLDTVRNVSADFLQNSFSWIFLPEEVEVSVSIDGKNFRIVSTVKNTIGVTREETSSPSYAFIKNFSCNFVPLTARYVRVRAANRKICPRWHPGYPGKAWIFTDEIVVE